MNIQNVGSLSLGQWVAVCRIWNKAQGGGQSAAPSDDEFEKAVLAARGIH